MSRRSFYGYGFLALTLWATAEAEDPLRLTVPQLEEARPFLRRNIGRGFR